MDIKNTPSKKFSLNNIKKLIEKHKGTNKFIVIDRIDFSALIESTPNGFSTDDKVRENGIMYK